MDITLWGEIEETEDIDKGSKNPEDKKNKILNSFEVPPLFDQQPYKNTKKDNKHGSILLKPPLDNKGQNHLMQSVELQHYKRKVQSMLAAAHSNPTDNHQKVATESQSLSSPLSAAPLPPKRFCSSEGHLIHSVGTHFLSTEFTAKDEMFMNKMEDCPYLSTLSLRQLLLKSIACIIAHSGFEIASESCLNLLTDIAVEHFMKLCSLLRERLEHSSMNSKQTDIIKLIFSEVLMESLSSLQDYWLKSVKQVAVKFEKENIVLVEEYNLLRDSSSKAIKEEIN